MENTWALNWPLLHCKQFVFLGAPGSVERADQFDNNLYMPYPKIAALTQRGF
ncbi:hypothetical protein CBOM_07327 [Ceraceosorus bombacis]|uniref:Uncharacterized protein n=1 Tax=Ceraceosorus bombacis TaxID=401625 RepID=A0A0N7L350_9BASI|nr:hypothetical protein CBOM_07327 [Ceraceosorus bombacis]